MDLFNKQGFENTKIADIIKKTNLSVGAFYHYYSSKSDIFSELYNKIDEYYENTAGEQLGSNDFDENLAHYFKEYAHFISISGTDTVKQFFNTRNLLFVDENRYMYKLLVKIIEKGEENNQLTKTMTVEEIKELLIVTSRGMVYDWLLHRGNYNLEAKMENLIFNLNRVLRASNIN